MAAAARTPPDGLSDQEALAQLAAKCHVVVQAGRLAAWVGEGKAVTAKGVLRRLDLPAVARALDIAAPEHVVSAAHVKAIHHPWTVAEAAGMIAVGATRAVAVPDAGSGPLEVWRLGLEAVLRVESLDRARRGAALVCPALLAVLAEAGPGDAGHLDDAVRELLGPLSLEEMTVLTGGWWMGTRPVDVALDVLAEFGAVDDGRHLTPLGQWAQVQMKARLRTPIAPELGASEVLRRVAEQSEEDAWLQVQPWLASRSADAATELLHAATGATASERVTAVDIVSGLGDDALPAWKEALHLPNLALYARLVLARGHPNVRLSAAQERWLTTEYGLAELARSGVEEAYFTVQERNGMDGVRRSRHPEAAALFDALSRFVASGGRVPLYQLKIALRESRPATWRRVLVPASATLDRLHSIVQVVMGWSDDHLHAFTVDGMRYSDSAYDLDSGDEDTMRLAKALPRQGARIDYVYDFGASNEHEIALEAIRDPDDTIAYPRCVDGRGDQPVEHWDPDFPRKPVPFDVDAINRRLARLKMRY